MHSPTKRPFILGGAALVGAVALTLGGAAAANAHVTIAGGTVTAGSYEVLSFSVPHGCDGSATTKVAIQIPEGINAVTATRNSFYTVEKQMEDLDTPITDGHGNELTQRPSQIVYTATTPLPADQRDVFELSLKIPEDAEGQTLYFPTVQTCEKGETAWVQIPAEGQDAHDLDAPSPRVTVLAASGDSGHGDSHGHGKSDAVDTSAGHGSAAAPVADQTPLVVTSLLVGGLGLIVALVALFRRPRKA